MNDCGCEKARKELEEYLHNELCSDDAADIRAHIESCVECAGEHQIGLVLTEVVSRASAEDAVAPSELRAQVMTRLRVIQSAHPEQSAVCACGHANGSCQCSESCPG